MKSRLNFRVEAKCSSSMARAGRIRTLHNEVLTPVFMPVGTQATVKNQTLDTLMDIGFKVLLANTYHLILRPGIEVFKKLGGIHSFMRWEQSVLTDSGGFQIYSLSHARQITEEGACFRSYVDGKKIFLSPEMSIETQKIIGSDIMMVLDQCVPSTCTLDVAKAAMDLTHRWAIRSYWARGDSAQSLFAICQGACFPELRKESAKFLSQHPFDGFAIGGLAVGESKNAREDLTELTTEILPQNYPRYLMGVGTPIDLLEAIHRGTDMMDCILPTSLAQRGVVYTSHGRVQLRRGVYKFEEIPLDAQCSCKTCITYSRAYLHHLIKTEESLGWHLLGLHNLTFYQNLMNKSRQAILEGNFESFYQIKRKELVREDQDFPVQRVKPNAKKIKSSVIANGSSHAYLNQL